MTPESEKEFDLAIKRQGYHHKRYMANKESIIERSMQWYHDNKEQALSNLMKPKNVERRRKYASRKGKIERLEKLGYKILYSGTQVVVQNR